MRPNKNAIIAAVILVVLGMALSGACLKLYNVKAVTDANEKKIEITDKITKLDVLSEYNNIIINSADTDKITVRYFEGGISGVDVYTQNDTLIIRNTMELKGEKWYDKIVNIDFHAPEMYDVVINLPRKINVDTVIDLKYGELEINDLNGSLTVNSACGDAEIKNGEFSDLNANLKYGDLEIASVAAKNINIRNKCGDIEAERISGENITADVSYGDIEAEMIKYDNISLKSDCGDIDCLIDGKREDYTINSEARAGETNIFSGGNGSKKLDILTRAGDLSVEFTGG